MRQDRANESGLTLVEVVVALVVLGVLAMATLSILLSSQRTSVDARNRVAAANLAAREIDIVREKFLATDDGPLTVANEGVVINGNPLAGGTVGQPLQVDGGSYTVRRSATWNITGTGASACEGGTAVEHPSLVIDVEVTWPGMGTTQPVRSTTVLAPERGQGLDSTAAFVAIMVKDSRGAPNAGRTVVVSSSSESRSAVTDPSGCAVVALNPPAGGAEYTARFPDSGYVDMSGATSPERLIGLVVPGQLVSNVQIAIDRAGELRVRLTGSGLSDSDVAGSTVSLIQAEASGSSVSQHTASGIETLVTGLWPTSYSAFFGTEIPAVLPASVDLPPGGSVTIEIPFEFARFAVTGLSPGGGTLYAAPTGGGCDGADARPLSPSAASLPPGVWTFYYEHPDFGCSEGPSDHELFPGVNSDLEWQESRLTVTGAPTGAGSIWAVPGDIASGSCTDAGGRAIELSPSGGTVGPRVLPAGNWYVFAMPKVGGQPSGTPCVDAGLVAVPYEQDTTFAWPASSAMLTVTNVPSGWGDNQYRVVASPSSNLSCSTSSTTPAGAIQFSPPNSATQSSSLSQGTWYIYRQRTSGGTGNRCTGGFPITIGWAPSYTMDFSNGNVTTP